MLKSAWDAAGHMATSLIDLKHFMIFRALYARERLSGSDVIDMAR
mgnify:CR=1 FL=1